MFPELGLLAKIAPMVLTTEQEAILEWARFKRDLYLSKHPELKGHHRTRSRSRQIAAEIRAAEEETS